MREYKDLHKEAVEFLKALEPADLAKALMLNKKFNDMELPKSGYDCVQDAFIELVRVKTELSLTEAIIIISNPHFQCYIPTAGRKHDASVNRVRWNAEDAWCEAVRRTAADIYGEMWQDWLHGKGSCAEIVSEMSERTDRTLKQR